MNPGRLHLEDEALHGKHQDVCMCSYWGFCGLVTPQVKGCCEGSAASALWEKFGENLRKCQTIGPGKDPLWLDVTITEGQEEEEDPGSSTPTATPHGGTGTLIEAGEITYTIDFYREGQL